MNIGEKLRKLREGRNMTQKELGDFLGKTVEEIQQYENDTAKPDSLGLFEICKLYNIDGDYFIEEVPTEVTIDLGEGDNLFRTKVDKVFIVDKLLEFGFSLEVALSRANISKLEYNELTSSRRIRLEEVLRYIGYTDEKIEELVGNGRD